MSATKKEAPGKGASHNSTNNSPSIVANATAVRDRFLVKYTQSCSDAELSRLARGVAQVERAVAGFRNTEPASLDVDLVRLVGGNA